MYALADYIGRASEPRDSRIPRRVGRTRASISERGAIPAACARRDAAQYQYVIDDMFRIRSRSTTIARRGHREGAPRR